MLLFTMLRSGCSRWSETRTYLTQWGCSYPVGVAVDGSGNVYTACYYSDLVQKFTTDGTYLTQWGTSGNGDGQFHGPHGIAVVASNVYVTDVNNNRVQVFGSLPVPTQSTSWGRIKSLYR
jgi:tripartite motif-containing protein 71